MTAASGSAITAGTGWLSRPLTRFVLRRFGAMILLLLGITLVTFVLTALVPGNPAEAALGPVQSNNPVAVRAWDAKFGFNRPLPVHYAIYVWQLLHGDLGISQTTGNPVSSELATAIPATVELGLAAIVIALTVGTALGVLAAMRRGRFVDQLLRVVSLAGISVPQFVLAFLALYFFFFRFGWLPGGGQLSATVSAPPTITGIYTLDALLSGQWSTFFNAIDHLILPTLVLAVYTIGYVARYTRTAVLEVITHDYIRAAYAKGLPTRTVVVRYILRAALPSMIQVFGLAFAAVLTGAVLIETMFSWAGVGEYAYQAAVSLNLPAISGVTLFIAFVYIVVNFVVDLLHTVIDPRVRIQ
jgi:peptide/nickel transport system permease protein